MVVNVFNNIINKYLNYFLFIDKTTFYKTYIIESIISLTLKFIVYLPIFKTQNLFRLIYILSTFNKKIIKEKLYPITSRLILPTYYYPFMFRFRETWLASG